MLDESGCDSRSSPRAAARGGLFAGPSGCGRLRTLGVVAAAWPLDLYNLAWMPQGAAVLAHHPAGELLRYSEHGAANVGDGLAKYEISITVERLPRAKLYDQCHIHMNFYSGMDPVIDPGPLRADFTEVCSLKATDPG